MLSLANLRRWPLRPLPANAVVVVVENPSLVAEASGQAGGWAGPPLVCSSGRPTVATVTLLRQLGAGGARLLQHADLDPAGLRITAWLAERAGTIPWRMTATDYLAAVASSEGAEIEGLIPGTPWDPSLQVALEARRCPVYEEQVRKALMDCALRLGGARHGDDH